MKNKYNVRPIVFILVIMALIISTILILSKAFDDNSLSKSKNNLIESEVIRVVSEDETIMIDNVTTKKSKSKQYLVFDVVKLDKTIENVKFNIVLLYDGDSVFEEEIIINSFGNNDRIKKQVKLNDFKYKFDELSVALEKN